MSTARPAPTELHTIFVGDMNEESAQRLFMGLSQAVTNRLQRMHMLFNSNGGIGSYGIAVYNFLRTLPIDLTVYNTGTISSAGVIAYLGAKRRKVSKNAYFMIHRASPAPIGAAPAEVLRSIADTLEASDRSNEAVLRSVLNMPEEKWRIFRERDLIITADEAVAFGIADGIADFTPPPGMLIYF